jgi:tripartite-type tricarboxylate transporter receptor subunit TctC
MITKRQLLRASAGSLATMIPTTWRSARAQSLRSNPRLIVGFPPGGPVDIVGRLLIGEMKDYAATIIVENRPGAGGRLALETLKASPADGSVFLLTPASMIVIYPHVYKTLGYSPARDFIAVTPVCAFQYVLAIGPKVPSSVTTLAGFIAWCRGNPHEATYGSPSAGSVPHFTGVMLARAAGVELLHVPYNGTAPAMQDLLGGQIAANITVLPAALPQVQAGRIRALATTGSQRSPWLAQVPTFKEAGYPAVESDEWFGIFLPARTPADIVDKLNHVVRKALKADDVKAGLTKLSFEIAGSTPGEFSALIKASTERWEPIVHASGFRPED